MILLDTDVCIEILRKNITVLNARQRHDEDVGISFVTVGELYYGAQKSSNPEKNMNLVEEFLITINVIHSNHEIMKKFGILKAHLKIHNQLIPDADILIASTAFTTAQKLVTGNIKHFQRFPDLIIEDWIRNS
ncbi:MAG: type II toxin-antitoxin system VapC family toxin [Spirochaetia bacterium]|nr:type II toxin-antitoxin system VapC family toxin [Spirochaetia bacterium]